MTDMPEDDPYGWNLSYDDWYAVWHATPERIKYFDLLSHSLPRWGQHIHRV